MPRGCGPKGPSGKWAVEAGKHWIEMGEGSVDLNCLRVEETSRKEQYEREQGQRVQQAVERSRKLRKRNLSESCDVMAEDFNVDLRFWSKGMLR